VKSIRKGSAPKLHPCAPFETGTTAGERKRNVVYTRACAVRVCCAWSVAPLAIGNKWYLVSNATWQCWRDDALYVHREAPGWPINRERPKVHK